MYVVIENVKNMENIKNMKKSGEHEKNCSSQGKVREIHFSANLKWQNFDIFWWSMP